MLAECWPRQLLLLALCWWSSGSVGRHAFVVLVCVHTGSYTCTLEMLCFIRNLTVFASKWCALASTFAYIVHYRSYWTTFFDIFSRYWLNIWLFVERLVVMRLSTIFSAFGLFRCVCLIFDVCTFSVVCYMLWLDFSIDGTQSNVL